MLIWAKIDSNWKIKNHNDLVLYFQKWLSGQYLVRFWFR